MHRGDGTAGTEGGATSVFSDVRGGPVHQLRTKFGGEHFFDRAKLLRIAK